MHGTRVVNSSHVGLYTSIKTAAVYGNSPGGISQVAGKPGAVKTGPADEPCPGPAGKGRKSPGSQHDRTSDPPGDFDVAAVAFVPYLAVNRRRVR